MISNKATRPTTGTWRRYLPWLNLFLTVILIIAGIWYMSTRVSLAAVGAALAGASMPYVALAVALMLLTIVVKAWRWQLMFAAEGSRVPFSASFWAVSLGQYVNLIVPFLRVGEIARLYALNQEAGTSGGRGLGTLVVEKTLDLIFFGLTILSVLPFIILPEFIDRPGPLWVIFPLILFVTLYLLAYQTARIIRLWRRIISPLPERPRGFLLRLAVTGLEGLAALRNPRITLAMLLISLVIAVLAVALPYALFPALGLPLGVLDAALVHIAVSIAITPPSTPAKIGIFNGAAALALWQLGVSDETRIAGYAILLYLVVVGPQLALGFVAASRTKWRWHAGMPGEPLPALPVDTNRS